MLFILVIIQLEVVVGPGSCAVTLALQEHDNADYSTPPVSVVNSMLLTCTPATPDRSSLASI